MGDAPATADPRWRSVARRRRDDLRFWLGLVRLLGALALGRPVELWVGDSHSVHLTIDHPPAKLPRLQRVGPGRFVWHLGPRLLFSIARDGFPSEISRFSGIARFVPIPRRLRLVLVFGEIDVRCHLGPRVAAPGFSAAFAATFVERCGQLSRRLRATDATVLVPVPPGRGYESTEQFPIRGSLDERLAALEAVRRELAAAVGAWSGPPPMRLLDATPLLADPDGVLQVRYTFDGCHVNLDGAVVVRTAYADQPGGPERDG